MIIHPFIGESLVCHGLVELNGWNGAMSEGSNVPGHQAVQGRIGAVGLTASRMTIPACVIVGPSSPEFVLFTSSRYECTVAQADYGEGWEDHYLARPWPIHLIPSDAEYRWVINGSADILALSWRWSDVQTRYPEMEGVSANAFLPLCRRGFEDQLIRQLIERLCKEWGTRHPCSTLFTDSLFLSLLLTLLGVQAPDSLTPPSRERLSPLQQRRVIDFMQANLQNDIGLPELVAISGVSAAHFSRAFKAMFGRSPYRYLLDLRVNRAKELLTSGSESIAEVAMATGFGDQSRFTKVFGQATGITPSAWRATSRKLVP